MIFSQAEMLISNFSKKTKVPTPKKFSACGMQRAHRYMGSAQSLSSSPFSYTVIKSSDRIEQSGTRTIPWIGRVTRLGVFKITWLGKKKEKKNRMMAWITELSWHSITAAIDGVPQNGSQRKKQKKKGANKLLFEQHE